MSILSAETLFHYTKKQYLINILKKGFAPRYSKEFEQIKGEGLTLGDHLYIPMVCFCDTPLSLVEKHMDIYGPYGIGLSKKWGIENKLNPVFYINKESTVHMNLILPIHGMAIKAISDEFLKKIVQEVTFIFRYMKPYKSGSIYERNGIKHCDYLYYDEKEWRYVPDNLEPDQELPFLNVTDIEKEKANRNLEKRSLRFSARDINFIIINEESDIGDILKTIGESDFLNKADKKYILTTLITTEGIRRNF